MDECINFVGDVIAFSDLYANSGSCQVDKAQKDYKKTGFSSHYGLFMYVRMLFGLQRAPGTFQRHMDVIMSLVK